MRVSLGAALACLAALTVAGCRGLPTGPGLTNVELTYRTEPTIVGEPSACCCRVKGTAANRNDVPVHVTIKFTALDAQDAEISRTVYFIRDFQRGASHEINAAGFVFPCAAISRLSAEVEVRGITDPPM